MSIAKLAEYAENIFTIVFSVLWILAFLAAFVLGILWVIAAIKEKKEKARNEQLDCRSCIYFQRRIAIGKAFDALRREDSAKERENNLEEKKDEELLDYDAPEDPNGNTKPEYWYVYAENSEEMYGLPKGRNIHIGAYKTEAEAERLQYLLAKEGKWENMFVFPADWFLCSETVRIEVGELDMGMVLIPVSCTMSQTSVHSSSGTL